MSKNKIKKEDGTILIIKLVVLSLFILLTLLISILLPKNALSNDYLYSYVVRCSNTEDIVLYNTKEYEEGSSFFIDVFNDIKNESQNFKNRQDVLLAKLKYNSNDTVINSDNIVVYDTQLDNYKLEIYVVKSVNVFGLILNSRGAMGILEQGAKIIKIAITIIALVIIIIEVIKIIKISKELIIRKRVKQ